MRFQFAGFIRVNETSLTANPREFTTLSEVSTRGIETSETHPLVEGSIKYRVSVAGQSCAARELSHASNLPQ